MASPAGCEFNLHEIYYGFRGESTIHCEYLYSQIRRIFIDFLKFRKRHFWQIFTRFTIDSVFALRGTRTLGWPGPADTAVRHR